MHNRLSTILLTLPLLPLMPLACDSGPYDPFVLEDEGVEEGVEQPSAALAAEADPQAVTLAEQIAQHPAYPQLAAYGWAKAGDMLQAYAVLDDELAEEEIERMGYCRTQAQPVNCYNELKQVEVTIGLAAPAKNAGQTIASDLGLGAMSRGDLVLLFQDAQLAFEDAGGAGGSPALVPDSFGSGIQCGAGCKNAMLGTLAYVQAGVSTAAAKSSGGGSAFGDLLVDLAVAVAEAVVKDYLDCLIAPDCFPWPFDDPDDNECTKDSDCLPDGFCHKGPLGIGDNECRDKKENGEPCSRDAKCESDCCKFNLWDFGSTCRPANQCN